MSFNCSYVHVLTCMYMYVHMYGELYTQMLDNDHYGPSYKETYFRDVHII